MYRSSFKSRGRLLSNLNESDLARRGGKLAPTTMWLRVPRSCPTDSLSEELVGNSRHVALHRSLFQEREPTNRVSMPLRRLNRRRVALAAFKSLQLISLCFLSSLACGDSDSSTKAGLRIAEPGRSYAFHETARAPWIIPKLFEAPDYDSEWTYIDEEDNEEVPQPESVEQIVENPPAALCGNGVLEIGEACDLGAENGHWDEGRSFDALCTLTCQDPVWRGDLYLEEVSYQRLESLWVIDGDVHLDAHLPWGLMWRSVREIRGDIYFHHDSPVIHVDFPLLTQLTGNFVLHAFTAPHLESVQAPRLRRIEGELQVLGHENIETLEFDQLTYVGRDVVITENDSLEVLELPVLQRVENDFRVTENPLLCEPWEMFEDWQWVSVYADMELARSDDCPFVVGQEN